MGGGELLPTLTGAFEGARAREEPIFIYLLKKISLAFVWRGDGLSSGGDRGAGSWRWPA